MIRANRALSVVVTVTSEGDEDGRDYVERLNRLISSLELGVQRWRLPLEVVVVDWRFSSDALPLGQALRAPTAMLLRVIEVPTDHQRRLVQDTGRRFHEYAAKNIGVVRARNERVLVTNADVLIRSDLLRFCVRAPLGNHAFVRADRYDFRGSLSTAAQERTDEVDVFVARTRHGIDPQDAFIAPVVPGSSVRSWPRSRRMRGEVGLSVIWGPRGGLPTHFLRGAHTPASGDFICVSKTAWRSVGGYIEDPRIWLHTDALMVAQLMGAKLRQTIYSKPGALLHEDHPRGPDEERWGGAATWPEFLEKIQSIIDGRCSPRLNEGTYGLEGEELPEYVVS